MSGTEMLIGLAAAAAAFTPLTLIWLTLRGTTPQQRRDLLPVLAEALRALLIRHYARHERRRGSDDAATP